MSLEPSWTAETVGNAAPHMLTHYERSNRWSRLLMVSKRLEIDVLFRRKCAEAWFSNTGDKLYWQVRDLSLQFALLVHQVIIWSLKWKADIWTWECEGSVSAEQCSCHLCNKASRTDVAVSWWRLHPCEAKWCFKRSQFFRNLFLLLFFVSKWHLI